MFLQNVFVDQIGPYNSQFNTKYPILQYIYTLWQTYYSDWLLSRTMLSTSLFVSTDQRQKRSLTQDVIPFLHNIIFQYTNSLSFETEPHNINTTPLAREHCGSYLYYF